MINNIIIALMCLGAGIFIGLMLAQIAERED